MNNLEFTNVEVDTCTLDDIIYEESLNQQWTVNDMGEQDTFLDDGGSGEFTNYLCDNCEMYFDTWQEVKDHLKEATK